MEDGTIYTVREGATARMVRAKSRAQAWAHVRQGISLTLTSAGEAARLTMDGVAIEDATGVEPLRIAGEAA